MILAAGNISHRMQQVLEAELRPGERVVWVQQPRPWLLVRKHLGKCLVGIPFFAFAVFWTLGASGTFGEAGSRKAKWPVWFPFAWGGMFMAIGAGMLLSPLFYYWKAWRTVYAITDQRAILIEVLARRTIHSFSGERLVDLHRVENAKGEGDLVFHQVARQERRRTLYEDVGFLGIEQVRQVEERLRVLYQQNHNG